jgi:phage-related minor tail protein
MAAANAEILAEAKRKFGVDDKGQPNFPGTIKMPKIESAGDIEKETKAAADGIKVMETVLVSSTRIMDTEWLEFVKNHLEGVKKRIEAEKEATRQTYEAQRTFTAGWKDAFTSYVESATNAAQQAQSIFQSVTRGMEDLIVNFVQTGKLNFKDFANSVIADFVRIQARKVIAGVLGGAGTGSLFEGLVGRATGGPVSANTPYLVGERGPELFVSSTAGRIVSNNQLNQMGSGSVTNVSYTINATDAQSFRQMLAREPEFLYAVTEKGRSSLPAGSRR